MVAVPLRLPALSACRARLHWHARKVFAILRTVLYLAILRTVLYRAGGSVRVPARAVSGRPIPARALGEPADCPGQ